jgi:hypothetical protein
MGMDLQQCEKDAAEGFWLWMIKTVKPEVIDGKEFIECHGFKDGDGFVPILSLEQLIARWYPIYIMNGNEGAEYKPLGL